MRKSFPDLLAAPAPAIGTWSQFASAEAVDILAASGFAFTVIDTEHGYFGLETGEALIRAADAGGLVPLLRVPANEPWMIMKALDAGAAAVVVPKISSPAEAEAAVRAGRYEPDGTRGACPCIRAADHFTRDWPAHVARAHRDTAVVPLIETAAAAGSFAEIVRVPGIGAVLFGPFDLSVALGRQGDFAHADVMRALEQMVGEAAAAGVPAIMPIFSSDIAAVRAQMARWRELGVGLFTIGTDKLFLADTCRRYLAGLG